MKNKIFSSKIDEHSVFGFLFDENNNLIPQRVQKSLISEKKSAKFISSILKEVKNIYDLFPESECKYCGKCCKKLIPKATSAEIIYLYNYIKSLEPELYKKYQLRAKELFEKEKSGNHTLGCVFYDKKTGHCLIYKVRPFNCRSYGLKCLEPEKQPCKNRCSKVCDNVKLKLSDSKSKTFNCIDFQKKWWYLINISPYFISVDYGFIQKQLQLKTWIYIIFLGDKAPLDLMYGYCGLQSE